ncbi:MAG: hypothetical protein Ct9H300mP1_20080 [Planctomycetaceae bacterium]|nr:MAG: hypothetical protein Ct9H300mP1_20080 [Planctomycetaceae bacterium]
MGFAGSFYNWPACGGVGFAQSASVPAIAGVMADCFTPKNRSTAVGFYNLSLNLAVVLVGTFGGQLADMPGMERRTGFPEILNSRDGVWPFSFWCRGSCWCHGDSPLVMPEPKRTERESTRGLGQEALHCR